MNRPIAENSFCANALDQPDGRLLLGVRKRCSAPLSTTEHRIPCPRCRKHLFFSPRPREISRTSRKQFGEKPCWRRWGVNQASSVLRHTRTEPPPADLRVPAISVLVPTIPGRLALPRLCSRIAQRFSPSW